MSKYQATNLSAYQRTYRITIENPYNGVPAVTFDEETVLQEADGTVVHSFNGFNAPGSPILTKLVTDYTETFDIYDPTTQLKTGQTMPIAQIYALIWSFYMNEAVKRDIAAATPAPTPPPPTLP